MIHEIVLSFEQRTDPGYNELDHNLYFNNFYGHRLDLSIDSQEEDFLPFFAMN